MAEDPRDLDLSHAYRQSFDRPLASPRHLRLAFAGFLGAAIAVAAIAVWLDVWWLTFGVIPIAMWAGAALAGLWPNWFFGNDASKDDFT